jgi:hypothetical protein
MARAVNPRRSVARENMKVSVVVFCEANGRNSSHE